LPIVICFSSQLAPVGIVAQHAGQEIISQQDEVTTTCNIIRIKIRPERRVPTMRIILTNEENERRLRKPNGGVVVWINGSDGIACVLECADLSGNGTADKVESEIPVETEPTTELASGFVFNLHPERLIRLRD
jgi:hypothetical protein